MSKKLFSQIALFFWAAFCMAYFIDGPGRRSGIQLFPLVGQSLNSIFPNIAAINFPVLLTGTLKAFAGEAIFMLIAYRYYLRPDLFACSSNKDDYLALEQAAPQSPNNLWEDVQCQRFRSVIYDSLYSQYILHFQNLHDLLTSLHTYGIVLYVHTFRGFDRRLITERIYQIVHSPSPFPKTSCDLKSDNW